jgi:hypothetical protein
MKGGCSLTAHQACLLAAVDGLDTALFELAMHIHCTYSLHRSQHIISNVKSINITLSREQPPSPMIHKQPITLATDKLPKVDKHAPPSLLKAK